MIKNEYFIKNKKFFIVQNIYEQNKEISAKNKKIDFGRILDKEISNNCEFTFLSKMTYFIPINSSNTV